MQKSRCCLHRRSCKSFLTALCFSSSAFPAGVPLHLSHGEQRLAQLRSRAGWAAYRAGGLHGHRPQPPLRHLPCDPLRQEAPDGESVPGAPPVGSAGCWGPALTCLPLSVLQIMMDIDGKHEWRDCIEVPGVRLPRGYYFGTSSITGDLSGTALHAPYWRVLPCMPLTGPNSGHVSLGRPGVRASWAELWQAGAHACSPSCILVCRAQLAQAWGRLAQLCLGAIRC